MYASVYGLMPTTQLSSMHCIKFVSRVQAWKWVTV